MVVIWCWWVAAEELEAVRGQCRGANQARGSTWGGGATGDCRGALAGFWTLNSEFWAPAHAGWAARSRSVFCCLGWSSFPWVHFSWNGGGRHRPPQVNEQSTRIPRNVGLEGNRIVQEPNQSRLT